MNSCSKKNRCGECHKCEIVFARRRASAAREASKSLDAGLRLCADCGQIRPEGEYLPGRFRCRECHHVKAAIWVHERQLRTGKKSRTKPRKHPCKFGCGTLIIEKGRACWPCYKAERKRNAAPPKPKAEPKPKIVKPPKPVVKVEPVKQRHLCENGCGTYVNGGTQLCLMCKSSRQRKIASSAEKNLRTRRAESAFKSGKTLGLMWIGEESLSMSNQCTRCKKPVIINTLCYSCATDRPRTLNVLPFVEYAPEPV